MDDWHDIATAPNGDLLLVRNDDGDQAIAHSDEIGFVWFETLRKQVLPFVPTAWKRLSEATNEEIERSRSMYA